MKVNKKILEQFKKEIILLVAFATILSVGIIMSEQRSGNAVNPSNRNTQENNITPAHNVTDENEEVYETVENGVYTNYKYGFRFEYPNDVFINVNFLGNPASASFNDNEHGGYPQEYTMRIGINVEREEKEFEYNLRRALNVPEFTDKDKSPINNYLTEQIREPNLIGYIKFGYFTEYAEDYEPTITHTAVLKHNDTLLFIDIGSPPIEGVKEGQYEILKDVISSLQFFDPIEQ